MTGRKHRLSRPLTIRRPTTTVRDDIAPDRTRISSAARIMVGAQVRDEATVGREAVALGAVTVGDHAVLTEHAMLGGTAIVRGRAVLSGWCAVIEQATVDGDAWVFGRAVIRGQASIVGRAQVFGDATVSGGAVIDGNAWIHGSAQVTDEAWVSGRAQVGGHAIVCGSAAITGSLRIGGPTVIGDGAEITCAADYETHKLSWGETVTLYRCDDGRVGIGRNDKMHGPVTLGRTHLPDTRLSARVSELMELWSTGPASLADD